jgi:septal ring-binding cell division protein DamX
VPAETSRPATSRQTASRQDWLDRAEKDRKRFVQQGKARYAVQLELACEVPSLVDAFQHDRPAGSMWLLATPFEGRTCFRVLWGRYATPKEAARGLAKSPGFFATPRNHPAVVPVR